MQLSQLSKLTIVLMVIIAMVQPLRGGPLDPKCNCNGHSFKCKSDNEINPSDDLASEEANVCLDCKHQTSGKFCELCRLYYYRDITKPLDHPEVCLPCLCNTYGSTEDGLCDRFNDESRGMTAGQCRCKSNVEGRACDQCKRGFYNFMNPEGCEPCDCDSNGSYATACDPVSGQCPCKPHLTGRKCDIPVVNYNISTSQHSHHFITSSPSSSSSSGDADTPLQLAIVDPTGTITNNVIEANTEGALDPEITAAITDVKREESTESTSIASE